MRRVKQEAPRALCGKSRTLRPQSTRGRRERLAVEVSYQQSTTGRQPVPPSKFRREETGSAFIWFLDVVHRPVVPKGDPIDQN